jgi:hypothetical protein
MEPQLFEQPGITAKLEDILASNPSKQVLKHFLFDRAKDFTAKTLTGKLPRSERRKHARELAKRFAKSIAEEQYATL